MDSVDAQGRAAGDVWEEGFLTIQGERRYPWRVVGQQESTLDTGNAHRGRIITSRWSGPEGKPRFMHVEAHCLEMQPGQRTL